MRVASSALSKPGRGPEIGWTLEEDISDYRSAIENALQKLHSDDVYSSELSKVVAGTLRSKGKRIRSVLCLLVCDAICGDYQRAIPVAVGYELAHLASLVQDDIIDESDLRHDEQTVHRKYGVIRAILISDIMLFDIFAQMGEYSKYALSKENIESLLSSISRAARLTAEGELMDTILTVRGTMSVQDYLKVAGLKTGSLFAASAFSGAVVADADRRLANVMYGFGHNIGVAFQIRDDVLDIIGKPSAIGKPIFKDVQNNTSNIILIHALSNADAYEKHKINSMLYKKWFSKSDVRELVSILKALGSFSYATNLIKKHTSKGKDLLGEFPRSNAKQILLRLTESFETKVA